MGINAGQGVFGGQGVPQVCEQRTWPAFTHQQHAGHLFQHLLVFGQSLERHKEHAIDECVGVLGSEFESQPRLSYSTWSREGDQAYAGAEQLVHALDFRLPTNEAA